MLTELAIVFFSLVAAVSLGMGLMHCAKAYKLLNKLGRENDTTRRELRQACAARDHARLARDKALSYEVQHSEEADELATRNTKLTTLVRSLDVERGASQRSVDLLSAELKKVKAREETLLRRVTKMQALQEKLGNSLELIYTDLKLREDVPKVKMLDMSIQCKRCNRLLGEADDGKCVRCLGRLCPYCFEEYGECGDKGCTR